MVVDWLKNNWFIFAGLLAGGIAWGALTVKVDNLEHRLSDKMNGELKIEQMQISLAVMNEKIVALAKANEQQDERVERLAEWLQKVNERVREMRENGNRPNR